MTTKKFELSPKAVVFVLEAIDFKIAVDRARIDLGTMDEDARAELGNDTNFLESVRRSLAEQEASQIAG